MFRHANHRRRTNSTVGFIFVSLVDTTHKFGYRRLSRERSSVYAGQIGQGGGPFMLDDDYKETAQTIAEERVALAGVRLANLINASLR